MQHEKNTKTCQGKDCTMERKKGKRLEIDKKWRARFFQENKHNKRKGRLLCSFLLFLRSANGRSEALVGFPKEAGRRDARSHYVIIRGVVSCVHCEDTFRQREVCKRGQEWRA